MSSTESPAIKVKEDQNIFVPKTLHTSVVNWWHVFRSLYIPRLFVLLVVVLLSMIAQTMYESSLSVQDIINSILNTRASVIALGWQGMVLAGVVLCYLASRTPAVFLVDFAVFTPPESWRVSHDDLVTILKHQQCYSPESIAFMEKLLARSGTGQATHWPPQYAKTVKEGGIAEDTVEYARAEFEQVVFPAVEEVLRKTGMSAKSFDFLIVNCSLFSPTPSLCAMVALKFQMRSDLRSYNLSGMGCSASLISIDLAKQLLAANPNSTALVISTENLTRALYKGDDRAMLLQNTLFRCGAGVMVLSNKRRDAYRAHYKLLETVRTQLHTQEGYECVYECQDDRKNQGIRLSKDIVKVAGKALTANLVSIGPLILPIREQIKVVARLGAKKYFPVIRSLLAKNGLSSLADMLPAKVMPYVPDFTRSIDHFCVHAGGRAVIDGIEQNLRLQPHLLEASRKTLYDFGNTSSSSIWYELRYLEESGSMKRGDRVLQIAFGSGFKCNSAVWIRLK